MFEDNLENKNKKLFFFSDEGTKFVALYAYGAQLKGEISLEKGDILLGKEKDRNGWMHGVKETNGLEGWFPAVYVDEVSFLIYLRLDWLPSYVQYLQIYIVSKNLFFS